MAYQTAPSDLRETLAKEQFIDALVSSDMRLRIKQARPTSLNMAVRHAVELEAFNKAERKHLEGEGYMRTTNSEGMKVTEKPDELKELKESMGRMQKTLDILVRKGAQDKSEHKSSAYYPPNASEHRPSQERRKRKCWTCGSENHLKNNCPHNKDRHTQNNKPPQQVASTGAGLFADCKINNIPAQCLIDTGATLTIMSTQVWENIRPFSSATVESYDGNVFTASGDPVKILGKTTVFIEIGGIHCSSSIIIADIDLSIILGLDFLKRHNCQIDVAANSLVIQGKKCKLTCSGSIGCYRIVVSNKVEIPAMSEMIIEGKVLGSQNVKNNLCIVEPKEGTCENREMLIARSLVYGQNKTPVRVMNVTNETKTLHPETNIATLSPVSTVKVMKQVPVSECKKIPDHLKDLYERTVIGMNMEQQGQVAKLLNKYSEVFSKSDGDIGRTGIIKHRIPTGDAQPIKQRPRRVPVHMNEEIDRQLENMLKENVITPSTSPWASSIVMVKKKDGSNRFCVDYRKLNDITIKDAYPLPRVDESLDQLAGSKWFSCLDLNSGYWQVETDLADREKTAFTSRRGLFEFIVMPFGLCNAPATFERLMETVLAGLHWEICLIYLDDVIVTGKSFKDMVQNLGKVFERF